MKTIAARVVVACNDKNGFPVFFPVIVCCSEKHNSEGIHYNLAEKRAEDELYKGPMISFDESDGPDWLFKQFDWTQAARVKSGLFS